MPGRKPASVMPTIMRSTYRLVGPVANMGAGGGDAPQHHDGGDSAPRADRLSIMLLGMPKIT